MALLSDEQVAAYAIGAVTGIEGSGHKYAKYASKWRQPDNIAWAVAVAIAESKSGPKSLANTEAHNPAGAYGLWQIFKPAHPELFRKYTWNNPSDNAKMAFEVWAERGGTWAPWTTYPVAATRFLARGRAAAGTQAPAPTEIPDPTAVLGKLNDLFKFITDQHNWVRVGYFLAGVILVWLALWQITGMKTVAKKAVAVYTRGVVNPK